MLKQLKTLIVLVMSLVFVGSTLAQENFTFAEGKLSMTLPAGWQSEDGSPYAILSNTLEGLEMGRSGDNAPAGSIIVMIGATADIEQLGGNATIAPANVVEIFMGASGMNGSPTNRSINGFDLVFAQVTSLELDLEDTEAAVMALETVNGTVFALISTGDTLADYEAELDAIYNSLTSASLSAAVPSESATAEGSTLSYNSSVTGTLNDSSTELFYTFSGTQGDVVTITMIADDSSVLDTWVWLLTSEGFEGDALVPLIDSDDAEDASVGAPNSQIKDFTLPETGEYSIRATRLGTGAGSFTLSLASDNTPVTSANSTPEPIRQWAKNANATSQYGDPSWAASQATDAPDAGNVCGDNTRAWASATTGTKESLTLTYETAVIPSEINIYQVYNPGSIIEVALMNSSTGDTVTVPNSADPVGNTPCPGVFSIPVSGFAEDFDTVIISLDQASVPSWTEIDAVELVGVDPASVTAAGETASKKFGDGTVMNYPARYSAAESDNTSIELTSPEGSIIRHEAITSFVGVGEDALTAALVDAFGGDGLIDPTRLTDVFGDGSVLQYQVGPREYFITFVPFIDTSKLLVVRLSESASEVANQAVLADAQTIAQQMSQP